MARARRFGADVAVAQEARRLAEANISPDGRARLLRREYPHLTEDEARQAINAALRDMDAQHLLFRANRGQFGNPARLFGCDDPQATVTLRMGVWGPNTDDGRRHYHEAEIDLVSRDEEGRALRLGDMMNNALAQLAQDAADSGYEMRGPNFGQRTGPQGFVILAAECW